PAGEHLDRQALQLGRPARETGAHPRDKRRRAIRDLGDAVLDRPFGRAQPTAPISVAVAGAWRGPVLLALPPHPPPDPGFQRVLHEPAPRELEQLGPGAAIGHALGEQLLKLLAGPLRCRYPRSHGDASSCRRRSPATLGLDNSSKSASPSRFPAIRHGPR